MADFPDYITARDAVEDQFGISQAFANEGWDLAKNYLDQLSTLTSFDVPFTDLEYTAQSISVEMDSPTKPDRPDIDTDVDDLYINVPTVETVAVQTIDVPEWDVAAPIIDVPETPEVTEPSEPGEPPPVSDLDMPVKPGVSVPSIPSLDDIVIPDAPEFEQPSFEGTLPDMSSLEPPGNLFVYNENERSSTLNDAIKSKLETDVEDGATGLGADVLDDIWDEMRSRNETGKERVYQEAEEYYSARGWTIPPGALGGRLMEALAEQTRADEQINYQISIEEARLAQNNTQFAVTKGLEYEGIMIEYTNQMAMRAFESAKATQDAAIAVFDASVRYYNLQLDSYKTAAAVFESKIRAALLQLEKHKAQLEGKRLEAEVQQHLLEAYRLQIAGTEALVNLYRAEMEAAQIKSGIDKTKIEAFRAKVDAYDARLRANTSRYNAYAARIAGEQAKAAVYAEEARAFSHRITAARAEADINIAEANAQIDAKRLDVERYRAEIEKYRADVEKVLRTAEAVGRTFGYDVQAFIADANLAERKAEVAIRQFEATRAHEDAQIQYQLKKAEVNLQAVLRSHELQIATVQQGANVLAQLTASALSAVSASASLGFSSNYSRSWDETKGVPTYSHVYNE